MNSFSALMGKQTLLPIIQANNVEQGIEIAKAMSKAGLTCIEVVLRTAASIDALKAIKQTFPELHVGAGTIIDNDTLQQAMAAEADFIVTPAVSDSLLKSLANCSVPVLPGVSNVADILMAREYGYRELKLFPASLSGGARFIAAMSSLFSDTLFCPTGGVNQDNKDDYLKLDNCFAIGGSWVANSNWVEQQNWQAITEACIEGNQ